MSLEFRNRKFASTLGTLLIVAALPAAPAQAARFGGGGSIGMSRSFSKPFSAPIYTPPKPIYEPPKTSDTRRATSSSSSAVSTPSPPVRKDNSTATRQSSNSSASSRSYGPDSEPESKKNSSTSKKAAAAVAATATATGVALAATALAKTSDATPKQKAAEPTKFGLPERKQPLKEKELPKMKAKNLAPKSPELQAKQSHYEDTAFRLTGNRLIAYMLLNDHPGLCAVVAGGGSLRHFILDYILCSALAPKPKAPAAVAAQPDASASDLNSVEPALAKCLDAPKPDGVHPAQSTAEVKKLQEESEAGCKSAESRSTGARKL